MPSKNPKPIRSDEESQAYLSLNPGMEFVLFGGKGGVGKTSLASAVSLHLARCHPEKRILIFSTDPAHSLSDSFKCPIGDKITPIQKSEVRGQRSEVSGQRSEVGGRRSEIRDQRSEIGGQGLVTNDQNLQSSIFNLQSPITNLFALEIEADKLFEDFKQAFKKDIEKLFDQFLGGGVDIKFDREVMMELLTLAPPGLDEIMALDKIMELRDERAFDIFILDTSPTGHLLRFLELPDLVRQWLKTFFRLLLKYRGVVSLAKAAEKALNLSRNVRRIQEDFADDKKTNFVSVTIPEAMGFLELNRLLSALDKAKIPCNHIVINMAVPYTNCDFCLSKRMEQQGYINKIHTTYPTRMVTEVPLFPHDVRGLDDLNKIGEIVFRIED